jgi:hypothetical protein
MQRVRIGLTGLAFVFLVVLLAAVFTRPSVEEAPITPDLIEQQERSGGSALPNAPQPKPKPNEPLAELGVAPGKAETNVTAPEAPPPPAPDDQP